MKSLTNIDDDKKQQLQLAFKRLDSVISMQNATRLEHSKMMDDLNLIAEALRKLEEN